MINKLIPKKLQKGDTIGILGASGSLNDEHLKALENAKNYFTSKGFRVKISPSCYKCENYLAGSDEDRIRDLETFFEDDSISAIIAARGGYGAIRILSQIDYSKIKPKIFAGFSDITAFQWFLYKKCGLISFHAPMACSDFGNNIDPFTEKSFFDTLEGKINNIRLQPTFQYNMKEKIEGILMPSNLATLSSLCGTDFFTLEKKLLMLEDVNEPLYKIDRMLTQLFENKPFSKSISAVLLGKFSDIDDTESNFKKLFENLSSKYSVPVCDGIHFGHIKQKLTIPFGQNATLRFDDKNIEFTEF